MYVNSIKEICVNSVENASKGTQHPIKEKKKKKKTMPGTESHFENNIPDHFSSR